MAEVGTVARVAYRYRHKLIVPQQCAYVTTHVRATGPWTYPSDLVDAATANAHYLANVLSADAEMEGVSVRLEQPRTGDFNFPFASPISGIPSGPSLPTGTTAEVLRNTNIQGRWARGKANMPWIPEQYIDIANPAFLTVGAIADVEAAWFLWRNGDAGCQSGRLRAGYLVDEIARTSWTTRDPDHELPL